MERKAEKREYNRRYREKNRERIREYQREYREKNMEYLREYGRTETGKKSRRIRQWKRRGIIADNWDEVYEWFIETETCDICDRVLTTDKQNTPSTKSLDHDHSITDGYNIRGVICHSCNSSEKSTHRHVYPTDFGYTFQKRINGKRFWKCFGTLEEAIEFRDAFDIKDYPLG